MRHWALDSVASTLSSQVISRLMVTPSLSALAEVWSWARTNLLLGSRATVIVSHKVATLNPRYCHVCSDTMGFNCTQLDSTLSSLWVRRTAIRMGPNYSC